MVLPLIENTITAKLKRKQSLSDATTVNHSVTLGKSAQSLESAKTAVKSTQKNQSSLHAITQLPVINALHTNSELDSYTVYNRNSATNINYETTTI